MEQKHSLNDFYLKLEVGSYSQKSEFRITAQVNLKSH